MGGGGSSSSNTTTNKTDITTITNVDNIVDIDLEPLGKILADSQQYTSKVIANSITTSNKIIADGQVQASNTDKETAQIQLFNSELDRQQREKTLNQLDTYIEHAKNGLVISVAAAALIYYAKNKKRR